MYFSINQDFYYYPCFFPFSSLCNTSSWGQHLVLLLDGVRNPVAQELDVEFTVTSRDETSGTWTGTARIPEGYFPPNVDRWNAYAIHNDPDSPTGDGRYYESLFPVPEGMFPAPDL
jgi:hypothetical protein